MCTFITLKFYHPRDMLSTSYDKNANLPPKTELSSVYRFSGAKHWLNSVLTMQTYTHPPYNCSVVCRPLKYCRRWWAVLSLPAVGNTLRQDYGRPTSGAALLRTSCVYRIQSQSELFPDQWCATYHFQYATCTPVSYTHLTLPTIYSV